MNESLKGKRIAIVATDMVEQVELVKPRDALEQAGATTELVSLQRGAIQAVNHFEKADELAVDKSIGEVSAADYDAVVLPGGVGNPDQLRTHTEVVGFIRDFYTAGKPIAAICHGPWLLVEADIVTDHRVTSWPSLRTDLRNAGATWVDEEVVADGGLVTSRKPDDIPAFNAKMIEEFADGTRARREPRSASVMR
jgi:protease I